MGKMEISDKRGIAPTYTRGSRSMMSCEAPEAHSFPAFRYPKEKANCLILGILQTQKNNFQFVCPQWSLTTEQPSPSVYRFPATFVN